MTDVDRALFLPERFRRYAYVDEPISIGYNLTCSQPSMVAFMLDQLEIQAGNKVLEIVSGSGSGSGRGYAAAVASILRGAEEKVWAVEMMPENNGDAHANIAAINADGSKDLREEMPFDRISLSAGVRRDSFNGK